MCRFLVYKGTDMLMAELLTRSTQSLIRQSYRAREREEPLNGDGFGVGWYADGDPVPCVITAVTPAWSNRNLHNLAEKLRTGMVFAHVRAASPGMSVTELNCHPFRHGELLWMHNGRVAQFPRIKRRLRESLSDERYAFIQGTTDSEHAFAVFLDRLLAEPGAPTVARLEAAMRQTIEQLSGWTRAAGIDEPSFYNFAVTDGRHIVASRYVDAPDHQPETLYYARGERFVCQDGHYRMDPATGPPHAVIVASEPLTEHAEDWERVPRNHLITIGTDLEPTLLAL
jgi:predicted glutamine amidotransferase